MQSVTQHPAVRSARPDTDPNPDGPKPAAPTPAKAADRRSSEARLRDELGQLIDQLELSPLQQRCLRARWVDTVLWMEGRATHARNRYYWLRLAIIGGGVLIPALISLELAGNGALVLKWATFGLSLVVAISAAVEGFFRYGERWRHYRRTVELLKAEGWRFLQRGGGYADFAGHGEAFPVFADRVEAIIGSNVETFVTELARERKGSEVAPQKS
jgi:hypothetical protein